MGRLFCTSTLSKYGFRAIAFSIFALSSSAFAGNSIKLNFATIHPMQTSALADMAVDQGLESTEYIMLFRRPLSLSEGKLLKKKFKVFGYLPDDAFVVRGKLSELRAYQSSHSNVTGIVKYSPQYKVSSDLLLINVFNRDELLSLEVQVFAASEAKPLISQVLALNPQVKLQEFRGRHLTFIAPRGVVPQMAGLTGVEHIEPTPKMELYDFDSGTVPEEYTTLTGFEDGTRIVGFPAAWSLGFTGQGQILGMADTGVDSGNLDDIIPDLQGAITKGYAFGLRSTSWMDPMGHGTHVAGLMVGRGIASRGLIRGGAFGAELLAGSMWSPIVKNMTVPNKLATLFDPAYQDGARVHSNSWGSNHDLGAYDDSAVQVDEWMFNNPDMLVVFAAGNNGSDLNKDGRVDAGSLGSPGTAKNCLTVGASKNRIAQGGVQGPIGRSRDGSTLWSAEPLFSSTMSDNEQGLAPFSSRGPTKDGRLKPDIVAPGTNILGTKSHQSGASSLWGFFNRDYTWSGGTSMAAPLTAGAVGVARQMLIEKWNVENPSAALLKAMILHSAEDLYPGQFGEIGVEKGQELLTRRPNNDEGYGRVNMARMAALGAGTQIIDNRTGVAQDQVITYTFEVTTQVSFYANLVWTDAAGSANAAAALVNDLDMQLTFPDGRVVSPNDHVNNLESLELSGLMPGIYQLTIKGYRVPQGVQGAQPFALVYSIH